MQKSHGMILAKVTNFLTFFEQIVSCLLEHTQEWNKHSLCRILKNLVFILEIGATHNTKKKIKCGGRGVRRKARKKNL